MQRSNQLVQESLPNCQALETEFRNNILQVIQRKIEITRTMSQCLSQSPQSGLNSCQETEDHHLSLIQNYRTDLQLTLKELFRKFLADQPEGAQDFVRQCFLNSQGEIEFGASLRVLRIQNPALQNECVGLAQMWSSNLEFRISDLIRENRQNGISIGQSVEQLWSSPISPFLSDALKYQNPISDQEIESELYSTYQRLLTRLTELKTRIERMSSFDLYKLYEFQDLYRNFTGQLSSQEQSMAQVCFETSRFLSDCGAQVVTSPLRGARCLSRIYNGAIEIIPILSSIDAVI